MMIPVEEILGALARGYCTDENKSKTLDSVLLVAQADEIVELLNAYGISVTEADEETQ